VESCAGDRWPSADRRHELAGRWQQHPPGKARRTLALKFCIGIIRSRAARDVIGGNKAAAEQSPLRKLGRRRVLFQGTTARQQWIVEGLYNDAVDETVEL
jgi:hypothetical protein